MSVSVTVYNTSDGVVCLNGHKAGESVTLSLESGENSTLSMSTGLYESMQASLAAMKVRAVINYRVDNGSVLLVSVVDPAAKSSNSVHANLNSTAVNAFPGPIANPAIPRNLRCVFDAAWDGGDVTIVGTDQYDNDVTEVIADVAGTTVVGVKIFKTITSITKQTVGVASAKPVSVGTGDKLGVVGNLSGTAAVLTVDGTAEAVTVDATYDGFSPTTAPDGAKDYVLIAK